MFLYLKINIFYIDCIRDHMKSFYLRSQTALTGYFFGSIWSLTDIISFWYPFHIYLACWALGT